jgi:polysaccharide pyruvyl transferase WcaK-like protein
MLSKKINQSLSLLLNEWNHSSFFFTKRQQFLLVTSPTDDFRPISENNLILPLHLLNQNDICPKEILALTAGQKAQKRLILQVYENFQWTPESMEKLRAILDGLPREVISIFINSPISNEHTFRQFESMTTQLFEKLKQMHVTGQKTTPLILEVNATNYLFADDLSKSISKGFSGKITWVAHPEYYQIAPHSRAHEFFHVRNFFDALSRDKSLDFGWRNSYHRFAMGKLRSDRALYRYFNSGAAHSIYMEIGDTAGKRPIQGSNLLLPECLFKTRLIPPIGITKLFSIAGILLKNKMPVKSKSNLFEVLPANGTHSPPKGIRVKNWKKVLITGWYGTETQGDKAILGEVLYFIKSASPQCKIVITTIHRGISEQTNLELEHLKGVELVALEKASEPALIAQMDAVIVGGGPLMESSSMKFLGYIFAEGYKQSKDRVIFGCGVGPIHSEEVEKVTRYMLSVCQGGFLRDEESLKLASSLFPNHTLKFACDPAVGFVSRWRKKRSHLYTLNNSATVATLLRANTNEFSQKSNAQKLHQENLAMAALAAKTLDLISLKIGACFELLHMNAPWVGGDDRLFNRILVNQLNEQTKYNLVRDYLTLEEHMIRLSNCQAGFAMRYHGHIFCLAMGIPFVSLDYTGKSGKVSSLVNRIDYANHSYQWNSLEPEKLAGDFTELLKHRSEISKLLILEAEKLVSLLNNTYNEVFNFCPE